MQFVTLHSVAIHATKVMAGGNWCQFENLCNASLGASLPRCVPTNKCSVVVSVFLFCMSYKVNTLLSSFICANKCTHTHTDIYMTKFSANAPTCFGASGPYSGSLYIVFAEVVKY